MGSAGASVSDDSGASSRVSRSQETRGPPRRPAKRRPGAPEREPRRPRSRREEALPSPGSRKAAGDTAELAEVS